MSVSVKDKIARAFEVLLQKKSIEKITVKDVAQVSGVSRQTFYYHFHDMMDVFEWCFRRKSHSLLETCLAAEAPEKSLELLIQEVMDSRELLEKILHSNRREEAEHIMISVIREVIREMMQTNQKIANNTRVDFETAFDFITFGIVGVIWGECGRGNADAKQICRKLMLLMEEITTNPDK